MRFFSILAVVISLAFFSCRPQRAIYNYLEDMKDTTMAREFYTAEPVIQKNDLLSVRISSASLNPEVDQLYNQTNVGGIGGGANSQLYGYLVDQKGNLELPRIGTVRAQGLTKSQLADTIKARLQSELANPSVVIRFMNFRIIVIGEVGAPGVHTVPVENLTILEALAMAGDITMNGKKQEVKVLRETEGKRELGVIDVTKSDMFESPYYQLQQNDVVMVEKTRYSVLSAEQSRIQARLGFALSIITATALLFNIFR